MKVKQTVAAVCLAAIMATSVGAAAVSDPPKILGKWEHGYLMRDKMAYSFFGFNKDNKEDRWHTAWAQVGDNHRINGVKFSKSRNGTLRAEASAFNDGTGNLVQNYWYKFDVG